MNELFIQLNCLAVSDGWVIVSNNTGTVAAKFINGRPTAVYYKTNRKQ